MLRKYGKKYSEEFIIEQYTTRHISIRMLAKELNISTDEIRYFLKKNNIHKKQSPGNFQEYRKHKLNEQYFDNINTKDKAYFLGFIYADGYINTSGLHWTAHKQDIEILKNFCKYLETDYDCIKIIKDPYIRLNVLSKEISNSLQNQGAIQNKTLVLTPPNISDDLTFHFIRGYFDGDGSIYYDVNTKSYRVSFLGTYEMLQWIKNKLGIKTKIRPYKKIARLDFSGNTQVSKILGLLYQDSDETIRLDRKYQKFLNCLNIHNYQEQHRKETWINNLGPYIRNGVRDACELSDQ